ncbi:hypothetical protein ABVK25_008630 [Lepraria finkii]|uniref:Uncharacterized protein n=1 Tax=Lepraria finkii TaxID=1340010 RepID=A0ABR4B210_9LECA
MAEDVSEFPSQCPLNLSQGDHQSWAYIRSILFDPGSYELRNHSSKRVAANRPAHSRQILRLLQEVVAGQRAGSGFKVSSHSLRWLKK